MRRFVITLLIALAVCVIFLIWPYILQIVRTELWSQALRRQVDQGPGAVVSLAEIGPADWDLVYVFHPYTPVETVQQQLGFSWPDAKKTSIRYNQGVHL